MDRGGALFVAPAGRRRYQTPIAAA